MAAYTIKINERSKLGKTFLQMIRVFALNNKKDVEIIEDLTPNKETAKILRENRKKKGLKAENAVDMFKKMGINV